MHNIVHTIETGIVVFVVLTLMFLAFAPLFK